MSTHENEGLIDHNNDHLSQYQRQRQQHNHSLAENMSGADPSLPPLNLGAPLDASLVMNSLLQNMTLQKSTHSIPDFNGKTPQLKDFLQDVKNGAVFVTQATEPMFIKAVLSKLKGIARDSVRDKTFAAVNELCEHLVKRFAPSKKYQCYFEAIVNLRMNQKETVSDYYDRLQGLLSGARHTLEEKYTRRYGQEKESNIMLKPVLDCALDAFIRGLPDDMSIFVDTRNPRDLSEAMEYALHIEERLDYTEKTRALASTFHVTKRDGEFENRRPLSPYTTQMASTDKHEKVSHENSKMVTFEQNSTHPSSTVPQSTPYPQFPHPFYGNMSTMMGGQPSYLGPQLPYPLYGIPYPYAALNPFTIGQPPQNPDWKNQGRPRVFTLQSVRTQTSFRRTP